VDRVQDRALVAETGTVCRHRLPLAEWPGGGLRSRISECRRRSNPVMRGDSTSERHGLSGEPGLLRSQKALIRTELAPSAELVRGIR